jgi:hypothetical protein
MLSVNPTTMDIYILKMKINRVFQCMHFEEIDLLIPLIMVSLADALKGLSLTSFENHDAGSQANQKGCRT